MPISDICEVNEERELDTKQHIRTMRGQSTSSLSFEEDYFTYPRYSDTVVQWDMGHGACDLRLFIMYVIVIVVIDEVQEQNRRERRVWQGQDCGTSV